MDKAITPQTIESIETPAQAVSKIETSSPSQSEALRQTLIFLNNPTEEQKIELINALRTEIATVINDFVFSNQQVRAITKYIANYVLSKGKLATEKASYTKQDGKIDLTKFKEMMESLKSTISLSINAASFEFEQKATSTIAITVTNQDNLLGSYETEINELLGIIADSDTPEILSVKEKFETIVSAIKDAPGAVYSKLLEKISGPIDEIMTIESSNVIVNRIKEVVGNLREQISKRLNIDSSKLQTLTQTSATSDPASVMAKLAITSTPTVIVPLEEYIKEYLDKYAELVANLGQTQETPNQEQGPSSTPSTESEPASLLDTPAVEVKTDIIETQAPLGITLERLVSLEDKLNEFTENLRQGDYGQFEIVNLISEFNESETDTPELMRVKKRVNNLVFLLKKINENRQQAEAIEKSAPDNTEKLSKDETQETPIIANDKAEVAETSNDTLETLKSVITSAEIIKPILDINSNFVFDADGLRIVVSKEKKVDKYVTSAQKLPGFVVTTQFTSRGGDLGVTNAESIYTGVYLSSFDKIAKLNLQTELLVTYFIIESIAGPVLLKVQNEEAVNKVVNLTRKTDNEVLVKTFQALTPSLNPAA